MSSMVKVAGTKVVELDFNQLISGADLTTQIAEAFGHEGVGVLTVANVPGYTEARRQLLPLSRQFALLSDEIKEKYVHKESFYSFGWSHGKEKLQGRPDVSKGSYYANPQYDRPVDDPVIIAKYPTFVHPNIWPSEELPQLEVAFKALGEIIVSTGKLVARQCDTFVHSQCPSYPQHALENVIESSRCCKARLLHYFPMTDDSVISTGGDAVAATATSTVVTAAAVTDTEFSSWCGWHNDHGSLTGLTSAMFLDRDGNEVPNPDPTAGLYVRNRRSELIKVDIPAGNIAFQIGETAQVHSGGLLQATPHAVRGARSAAGVSRETFAVFMEPMWFEPMLCPQGVDPSSAQSQSAAENLPPGVPPLATRWKGNNSSNSSSDGDGNSIDDGSSSSIQTFYEFSENTLNAYY